MRVATVAMRAVRPAVMRRLASSGRAPRWTADSAGRAGDLAAGAGALLAAGALAVGTAQLSDGADHKTAAAEFSASLGDLNSASSVFDRMASVERDGERFMTGEDFLRSFAVRHYGIQGMSSGFAVQEMPFLGSVQSGLVSRSEFVFWTEILSVNEEHLDVAFRIFDADGNGKVDASEFASMLRSIAQAKAGAVGRPAGGAAVPEMGSLRAGRHLFGPRLDRSLSAAQFRTFVEGLRQAIVRYEFDCYRALEGAGGDADDVSGNALALSLVAHAKPSSLARLAERASRARHLGRVSFAEYYAAVRLFTSFPNDMRDAMQLAQRVRGGVGREAFRRIAREVTGTELPESVVRVLFAVFDADGDGKLDVRELDVAMRNRSLATKGKGRPSPTAAFWACAEDTYDSLADTKA